MSKTTLVMREIPGVYKVPISYELRKATLPYLEGDKLVTLKGKKVIEERELTTGEINLLNSVLEDMDVNVGKVVSKNKEDNITSGLENLKSENLFDLVKELDKVLERENKKPLVEIASRKNT